MYGARPFRPSLESLSAEIETALVTARVALREYARGRCARGDKVAVQAVRAFKDIKRQLEIPDARGWEVGVLRHRFRDLRLSLDELAEQGRKAA